MKTAKKELLKIVAVAAAGVIAGTGVTAATIGAAKKHGNLGFFRKRKQNRKHR